MNVLKTALAIGWLGAAGLALAANEKPNILYILADDLGYGDVSCLNPELGKINTPHMDRLAREGMTFTDAHTSSSVCTPTRYSILTGRYNWRTELQAQVLMGFDQPLITPDRLTVAGLLKEQGYRTACIGKWHLGLGLPTIGGEAMDTEGLTNVDWKGAIAGGPVDLGFDYFYGISASLNIPPYVYIENNRVVGDEIVMHKKGRKGPKEKNFDDVQTLPILTRKTIEYIQRQDASTPFFIYCSLTSPHTPLVPTDEWKGKSGIGDYGDFVMHTDAIIGEIVDALDAAGLGENTIVVVTSDNGCSKWCGTAKLLEQGHHFSGIYRGSKGDLWEGGHRVPFLVRWPAKVKAGSMCDQLISLNDLMATCAELTGAPMPATAGEDSVSFLPALSGKAIVSSRAGVVHHSFSGHFAYRMDRWKLLLAKASGGWTSPTEEEAPADALKAQLYDMEADPGETTNLYASHPEVVERLYRQLEADVKRGRSTDGAAQRNDVDEIVLWK
ncbi:Arylsulfatase [Pontiella desulfatans]|uniref:Arylsulfatase n=1 Tax=Pontiella desulfatans TaxID=2750659 RepID=A0A6C2TVX6_PONDE|nr:arylsulfatase [Pontiella desulfatans]SPS73616.1 sulfatase S1_15 [Kiritimatiellales bacterium]VGO11769.1 Arylsulfatase [Pontiella desulfatans]